MATKRKARPSKASAVEAEVDPRSRLEPGDASFAQVLADVDAALGCVPKPEQPAPGDLVHAMMHIILADGLPCGVGQEAIRRIEAEYVDRNEFRVTEAYEVAELLEELGIPNLFERCLELHEVVAQIYNDQNAVVLEFLREAQVSERNNFFNRIPALRPTVAQFLVNVMSLEECLFSDRSTLRVRTRLGLDPKSAKIDKFFEELRARVAPYGHLPLLVGPHPADRKPLQQPALSAACAVERLAPRKK